MLYVATNNFLVLQDLLNAETMNNIVIYNTNKMHKSQSLFYLTTALHVSGVTITQLQERKTIVTTTFDNR
jgi:hypothetical protein